MIKLDSAFDADHVTSGEFEPGQQPAGDYECQYVFSDRAGDQGILFYLLLADTSGNRGAGHTCAHNVDSKALVLLDFSGLELAGLYFLTASIHYWVINGSG